MTTVPGTPEGDRFGLVLLPERASSIAAELDALFFSLFGLEMFIILLVTTLVIVFSIRYRKGSTRERGGPLGSARTERIEIAWTLPVLLIFVALFVWAGGLYVRLYTPPDDAMEITAIAKQWMWQFQHPNGAREINDLHVPLGRTIKINMTSQDVIHSLFVPAFRVKRDVLPNHYSALWFRAIKTGSYDLFCAEYCGTDHSRMRGTVHVLEASAYQRWLTSQEVADRPADSGGALYRAYGCSGCHESDSAIRAPSLAGLYGRSVPLASGELRIADDAYLRDSILLPEKDIVAGYEPLMPSYQGQISEGDMFELIAYLRSLQPEPVSGTDQPTHPDQ